MDIKPLPDYGDVPKLTEFEIGGVRYEFRNFGHSFSVTVHVSPTRMQQVRDSLGAAYDLIGIMAALAQLNEEAALARETGYNVVWVADEDVGLLPSIDYYLAPTKYRVIDRWIYTVTEQEHFPLSDNIKAFIEWFRQVRPPEPPRRLDGYVYILRSDAGYWKIGRAKRPGDRLSTFGVKLPFLVNYEIVIPSADYVSLEKELHERFDHCRVNGEWFSLTDEDIQALKDEFENLADEFNKADYD